ncbi:AraC family transcriptional regulator of adaptative response / DNA-3-methyladenine glycosylase II [Kitasatospora sp. MAA4]|uniref:AlkA N-terminal domain-containing protein n=1 Tax=Kitasatospora sp. MAA4 TaxID=3035093 RepID=UPI0024762B62|nr:AlkA N-terminal domain-containing protein [Kitasatospora sp. MAA4]MDH6132479.1 AraC family transcriptional regulator of adaptative response / DNA-3-methyladenine glycosylase II [Kitasatospora sp. MAA4]
MIDDETRYRAVDSRDARFDGVFFTAVTSTGIYCRPSCPAMTPKRVNCSFYPTAAAAQGAGFRACRRCRPDSVPGSPEWNHRADLVGRAVRLIGDGVVDREGVAGLADRLGYSARQLQRQLTAELGAGPIALARAQRAQAARLLLQTTGLPVTEVAFAAGFASVRQFNDTVRAVYDRTPSGLREESGGGVRAVAPVGTLSLRLAYRGPIDSEHLMDFLALRAVPGVEEVVPAGSAVRTYRRTLALPHGHGIAEVDSLGPGVPADRGWLDCRLQLADLRDLTTAVHRLRALFDLDADPETVAEQLGADPVLGSAVARRPGLRSPGHVDPHELAVRAVLGQQVTVAAARTLAGRLAVRYGVPLPEPSGGLSLLFPTAEALAGADPADLAMPAARQQALRGLCAALAYGTVRLDGGVDRAQAAAELLALRGIGPWTVGYLRMRAMADPDVFLPGDAGVRHGLLRLGLAGDPKSAERQSAPWAPWRSYAVHHLWVLAAVSP